MDTLREGYISHDHKRCPCPRRRHGAHVPLTAASAHTYRHLNQATLITFQPAIWSFPSPSVALFFFSFLFLPNMFELERKKHTSRYRGTWCPRPPGPPPACLAKWICWGGYFKGGGAFETSGWWELPQAQARVWKNRKDLGVAEARLFGCLWRSLLGHFYSSQSLSQLMTKVNGNPNKSREKWENCFPL